MYQYQKQRRLLTPILPKTTHFTTVDVELIKSLFAFQTPTRDAIRQAKFMAFLMSWLRQNKIKFSYKYDKVGNLYITKGTSPIFPCIVSHVDTVHDYNKDLQIANTKDLIFGIDAGTGEQHGIGADPKNGVYFALQMLKYLKTCKVVFFIDEECGCLGSKQADLTFFKDCSFVCQLDRRSFTTDIIEYTNGIQVLSEEFKQQVEATMTEYGYAFNHGTSTDVGELVWNGLGICAFNFSNGSFNEHCSYETCSIPHLLNAINAAYELIINFGYQKRWLHNPYNQDRYTAWGEWDDYVRGGKTKSSYYDRYESLFETNEDTIYGNKTVAAFIKNHVFKAVDNATMTQAAQIYHFDGDEELVENLIWLYDYHVGLNCDEITVCKTLIKYLKNNYHYLNQVKILVKEMEKYQRVLEKEKAAKLPVKTDNRCHI